MPELKIRPILKRDNPQIAVVIRSVLVELDSTGPGSTYEDTVLDTIYEVYQQPRASFYVIQDGDKIIGGGGISPLENYEGNVCELQKMYFLKEARGRGFGKIILENCLSDGKRFNYNQIYLETLTRMEGAQELYKKYGFNYIDSPMGNTGHFYCPVHMLKDL